MTLNDAGVVIEFEERMWIMDVERAWSTWKTGWVLWYKYDATAPRPERLKILQHRNNQSDSTLRSLETGEECEKQD